MQTFCWRSATKYKFYIWKKTPIPIFPFFIYSFHYVSAGIMTCAFRLFLNYDEPWSSTALCCKAPFILIHLHGKLVTFFKFNIYCSRSFSVTEYIFFLLHYTVKKRFSGQIILLILMGMQTQNFQVWPSDSPQKRIISWGYHHFR